MNENTDKVHIDYQGLLNQIADRAIAEFLMSFAPDEQTRKLIGGMIVIHRKYGIDAATSAKILQELGELMKEDGTRDNPSNPMNMYE